MSADPPPPAIIPVDPLHDETDSSYGASATSSTTSLSSSILDYRKLHGRTYSNYGDQEYWGPNDNKQNDQLDITHHMYTLILDNKLYAAPLGSNPQKVVDIGTGTGIWAIDFADEFPSAEVIGTDLSPIQPTFVPPNCKFEIDDAELEWTYGAETLDFVHLRCLIGCISDWPRLYRQAFKALKPGAFVEHLDMSLNITSDDGTVTPDSIMQQWYRAFTECGEKTGKTFAVFDHARKDIEEAGFIDVKETIYKVPVGGWSSDPKSKEIGRWNLLQLNEGLEGFALYLLSNVLKWEYTAIQAFVGQMKTACNNPRIHAYYEVTVVYGRKPEKSE